MRRVGWRRHRMKPSPSSQPDWKSILLAGPDWPKHFVIPQTEVMEAGSEIILESMFNHEHWEWELWRHPDGHCYYLKHWPFNQGKFGNPKTPGLELTVMEAFQFLMANWMPRDVVADMMFEHADLFKSMVLPPGKPGLN